MSPADTPFAPLPAPGPHPATAELRAYAAGTLPPAEEHRLETHLLDCERCADLVEGFAMSDAATTDRAVAELRARLQTRIGQEEPAPAVGGWRWPRLAAAAALVTAVGGGLWLLERPGTAPGPATARQEITVSAPPPPGAPGVAAPAAEPAASAEVAAAPQAPPAAKPAPDYAAVARPRRAHRAATRPGSPAPGADDRAADYAGLSENEAVLAQDAATKADAPASGPPATSSASGYAPPAAVPAKQNAALAARIAADSTSSSSSPLLASRALKSKVAAPASAPPAVVRNTPMPVTPALNPAPVGGTLALRDYLRREASQFVPEINHLRISGTVRIRFVVEADGQLSNLKVVRGLRKDYDDEALRLVCEGPAWQPGIAGGKRAPLPVELTVPF